MVDLAQQAGGDDQQIEIVQGGRGSLLWRLFGLVVISLLPVLASVIYNELDLRKSREREVRDSALRSAELVAGQLDRIIDIGKGLLTGLANLPAVRNHEGSACSPYAAILEKEFPQFAAIGAVDSSGRPFCASTSIPAEVSTADRSFFKQALETEQFVIGNYIIGRIAQKPVLPITLAFRDGDNNIAGVVYASLDLHWLAHYFEQKQQWDNRETLLIADRNAIILVRLPDNEKFVGTPLPGIYYKQIFAKAPNTDEIVGIDGVRRIIGFVPIDYPPIGLYVGVGSTKSDAFAAINRASAAVALLICIGLSLGLLVAWLGGRSLFSRPINQLVRVAAQWGEGNFEARANLERGTSEMVQLGRTFDRMAGQLDQQKQQNTALLATLESRVAERTQTLNAAQAELREANANLEARARELTIANSELQAQNARREAAEASLRHAQRIEALGELTGGVAHDFNNILQVMLGNLDALDRQLQDEAFDREKMRRGIEVALRAGERAATLTHQLLAFARRQPLAPAELDVNRLINELSDLLHRTLGETIELEIVLGARLWFVLADPNELESAIVNLAVNARDAMPAGGKLTIETSNAFLDEAYAAAEREVRHGQYILISVTDMGTGMTPETMEKAFEPFFTTKEIGRGTGLGLSQVYGFIKQSGGHVKIYSEVGKGTTVKLYLPRFVDVSAEATGNTVADVPPPRGNGEAVLVVEDNTDVRNFTVDRLRELGYRAIAAIDGPAALQIISTKPDIEVLLTDVVLPHGLDGRQLAEEAKRRLPDIKVLYVTGYARNAIVHQGRLDPGVELISKPFTYQALASKIYSLLNNGHVQ